MPTLYKFTIPDKPCSVNAMYFQRGLRRVLTPEYREFKNRVIKIIGGTKLEDESLPVAVHVVYIVPDKRKRDIDNIIKPLLDGITQAGFWNDDSIVSRLFVERVMIKGKQGLIVEIANIPKGENNGKQ